MLMMLSMVKGQQFRSLGFKKPYRSQGPFGVSVYHDPQLLQHHR